MDSNRQFQSELEWISNRSNATSDPFLRPSAGNSQPDGSGGRWTSRLCDQHNLSRIMVSNDSKTCWALAKDQWMTYEDSERWPALQTRNPATRRHGGKKKQGIIGWRLGAQVRVQIHFTVRRPGWSIPGSHSRLPFRGNYSGTAQRGGGAPWFRIDRTFTPMTRMNLSILR